MQVTEEDEDDELDLKVINQVHSADNKKEQLLAKEAKLQAFGVSHNLFDISSYGEVRVNHMMPDSTAQDGKDDDYDQSVSLVKMQDSYALDDIKAQKKHKNIDSGVSPIIEETSRHDS